MINFFATGEYFKECPQLKENVSRMAFPGEGARIYERNYLSQFDYEFKPTIKTEQPLDHYKTNFQFLNTDYSKQKYFNSTQSNTSSLYNEPNDYNKKEGNIEHYVPLHLENYKVLKTKFFIKQAKNPTAETQGNFVDKTTYKTEILNDENVNIGKSKNLGTKNMYDISKPLLRLDDLKKETATHALKVSRDTPDWCQTYSRFYTDENLESAKKLGRRKNLLKSDIFGNKIHDEKPTKMIQFRLVRPPNLSRFEKIKMAVIDKKTKEEKEELKKNTKESFKWIEDVTKQKYELKNPQKIGFTTVPFIRKLQQRIEKPLKIGVLDKHTSINKEKAVQVKIGHGTAEFLGKK